MYWIAILVFICGVISLISSSSDLTPEVRKNLPPEDIEMIYAELQARQYWGLLLIVISMFPLMIYLVMD
jgi:hypothetical protein